MTRTGARPSALPESDAQPESVDSRLQAVRFRLMTELGRGAVPMRLVNECFERVTRELSSTHSGPALVAQVERAVRAEFSPVPAAVVPIV